MYATADMIAATAVAPITSMRGFKVIGATAVAAIMWAGAYFIANQEMSPGALMSFIYLLDQIKNGATGIGNMSSIYGQVLAATDHVYAEVLDVESDMKEDENAITLPEVRGRVEFN